MLNPTIRIKANNLIVKTNLQNNTTSDINGLRTLNSTFLEFLYALLIDYSIGDEKGWRKTYNLLHQFGLLNNVKPIVKRLVFWCLTLTFIQLLTLILVKSENFKGVPPLSWNRHFPGSSLTELSFFLDQHNSEVSSTNQSIFSEVYHWIILPLDQMGPFYSFYLCFSYLGFQF